MLVDEQRGSDEPYTAASSPVDEPYTAGPYTTTQPNRERRKAAS